MENYFKNKTELIFSQKKMKCLYPSDTNLCHTMQHDIRIKLLLSLDIYDKNNIHRGISTAN